MNKRPPKPSVPPKRRMCNATWCGKRPGHDGMCDPGEKLARARDTRDLFVVDLIDSGETVRTVARRAGLSVGGVQGIVERNGAA